MRRALLLLAVAAALLGAAPATGLAAAAAPRTTLNDVEDELMCDTCNVPLNIADSARADQERREVRRLIAQGLTKQQILDRFKAEYGPNVLASPKGDGTAVALWAVPAGVIGLVLVALLVALPRWRRRRRAGGPADGAPPAALGAEDAALLERDLARYDL